MRKVDVIVVTGPTATGKTALAVQLAREFDGEIVSVDSRQVYRGMDLGTGKDLAEYGGIPYHLIDIADPKTEVYHLARFCADAFAVIDDISRRGKLPILCGGTALYLDSLLRGYRLPGGALPPRSSDLPRERQKGDAEDSFQPPFELNPLVVIGVLFDRAEVRQRIAVRLDSRLNSGMVEEIQRLMTEGVSAEKMAFFGLEYREISRFVLGEVSHEEMRESLLNKIRQFAKRQDIFFRKMEREGLSIHWVRHGDFTESAKLVRAALAGEPLPPLTFRLCNHQNH